MSYEINVIGNIESPKKFKNEIGTLSLIPFNHSHGVLFRRRRQRRDPQRMSAEKSIIQGTTPPKTNPICVLYVCVLLLLLLLLLLQDSHFAYRIGNCRHEMKEGTLIFIENIYTHIITIMNVLEFCGHFAKKKKKRKKKRRIKLFNYFSIQLFNS